MEGIITASIGSIQSRRITAIVVLVVLVVATLGLFAPPAAAKVTGGCNGSVDFTADSAGRYTTENETVANAIIVPKADGNVAQWQGDVPGKNTNFSGEVFVQLGPIWVGVGDWGSPNFDGSNDLDGRQDSGDYDMDEFWSAVTGSGFSKDWIQGVYNARAVHSADGVNCEAQFMVKFEGTPTDSPIVIITIVLLVIAVILLVIAGRRRRRGGRIFKGRPAVAIIAALLLAITIAILLQQFCKVPLNTTTTIILPIILIIIGLVVARVAPFGGPLPNGADPAVDDAIGDMADSVASGEIFEDGFESGDTSSWTDDSGD